MNRLRAFRKTDFESLVRLAQQCDAADGGDGHMTREQIQHQLTYPGLDIESCIFVMPDADGGLAAVAGAVPQPAEHDLLVHTFLMIRPDRREPAVGAALVDCVETQALTRAKETGVGVRLCAGVSDRQPFVLQTLTMAGFQVDRYFLELCRDLTTAIPEPSEIPDLSVRPMQGAADAEAFHVAFNESFRDHYNHVELSREQTGHMIGSPDFRTDLTLLAFDLSGAVAGVCANNIRTEHNRHKGTLEGLVKLLAVRRPYRKAGLGSALLTRSLLLLREEGMTAAVLQVDAENPTGATRLYERAGFVERKRSMFLCKALSTGDAPATPR